MCRKGLVISGCNTNRDVTSEVVSSKMQEDQYNGQVNVRRQMPLQLAVSEACKEVI